MEVALDSALDELRALCAHGFGPSGSHTLLFRPPDAPLITGNGHSALVAWKETLDSPAQDEDDLQVSKRGITRIVLSAVEGLHREIGDGASELVLLLHAASKLVARELGDSYRTRGCAAYRQLSRALGELKWMLKDEIGSKCGRFQLKMRVPIEVTRVMESPANDGEDSHSHLFEPVGQFRDQLMNVLTSALNGTVGADTAIFLSNLVAQWIFSSRYSDCQPLTSDLLHRRVQLYLKRASDAVMWMMSSTLRSSCVVPPGDFILRQSVVGAQQKLQFNDALSQCTARVRFLCISCPLSLHKGSNLVTVSSSTSNAEFDDWSSMKNATHSFVSRFISSLSTVHKIQLVICTEPIKEDVVALFTRYSIACVQYAEPDEVAALGIASGTVAVATLFDDITLETHIGICRAGVGVFRLQHRLCLRLRGIEQSLDLQKDNGSSYDVAVPQLLVYAPSKGIYKQYFECIVKALRVLHGWFKPDGDNKLDSVFICKGGGAAEFAIARLMLGNATDLPVVKHIDRHWDDKAHFGTMARRIVSDALLEVVMQLQTNIRLGSGEDNSAMQASRRMVLAALASRTANASSKRGELDEYPFYLLDQRHSIKTRAGVITCPQLVRADPGALGLVHPWARTEVLLSQTLATLEQLFRIDFVVRIKCVKALDEVKEVRRKARVG